MGCDLCQLRLRYPSRFEVATYLPGATFGPRQMRDWEFVWMIEGDARYGWNKTTLDAPEGSIVLCRPGGTDWFEWDKHRRTRHAYFHFHIDSIPGNWPAVVSWPLVRRPREGDLLRAIFRFLLTPARTPTPVLQLAVMQMLGAFVFGEYDCGDIPRESLPAPVDLALRYLKRTLDDDASASISLSDLAAAAEVTPEHLCRVFRAATGHSPSATVRLARLDRAAVLLARSNYSIGDIATMCGFASQFHFARRFKEAFGESARELRQRLDRGEVPPVPLLKKWGLE